MSKCTQNEPRAFVDHLRESGYENRAAHRNRLNFNKVPTTAFVSSDLAVLDNSLRNLSTKSISVYEALRAVLATDHVLINCILRRRINGLRCSRNY